MTRTTVIWFVGAAIVGAVAGGLHLLRSTIGGAHTGTPLAVSAFGLTALAAAMLFHGVVVAAREQDTAAGPAPRALDEQDGREPYDPRAVAGDGRTFPVDDGPDDGTDEGLDDGLDDGDDADGHDADGAADATDERGHHDGHDRAEGPDGQGHAHGHEDGDDRWAPVEGPDVYTFRGGKPITERAPRPSRRNRPSQG
ncbi:hypothetical protein GCM10009868_04110 [Terrabacter aerolatus]|uniref:Uncharacterized protein n=1 Tax=Terrabacter aerolatus TaxID=422442 RepID=A0A512CZB4_9MICO|nr:hypothetical protein [Terrabacter aerolatus]GEO29566.1 hypothetical protein TAE01_13760 [Terrabacter aerolatus]